MKFTVLALSVFSFCSTAAAAPAEDMKVLLEHGKDRQAYEVGKAVPKALGTSLFDFYFGVAALNAGAPGESVLALERYLLQFPNNRSAQFHGTRGYKSWAEASTLDKNSQPLRLMPKMPGWAVSTSFWTRSEPESRVTG